MAHLYVHHDRVTYLVHGYCNAAQRRGALVHSLAEDAGPQGQEHAAVAVGAGVLLGVCVGMLGLLEG